VNAYAAVLVIAAVIYC